ncbi:acyl-CoA dehydrogenase [Mumia zhuanghuii]|uniref:Acyl-CoA dehydrogenase family protein n=2 Tax=Mumia TaxID=1546255 RepID=A0ABW1QJM3_9ACTN|nr:MULTISPECIES: acyl-CoA dehydrogenase family protein [Mumia]KAA1423006.1 acyl-CoA dehydrogenase [Mumia zhuanghuii]
MTAFTLSEEETQVQATARAFLRDFVDNTYLNEQEESPTGFEASRWGRMRDLGWSSVHLPARVGGADGTLVDAALITRECGRAAYASPLLQTLRSATVLDAIAADKTYDDVLAGIVGGAIATLVAPPDRTVMAESVADGFALSGPPVVVEWLAQAEWVVLVLPTVERGWLGAVVTADSFGERAVDVPSIDNERMVRLDLDGMVLPSEAVRTTDLSAEDAAYALARADLLRASAMVGGAQDVVERSATYALERHQFGQPLGKFQAVRHHLARMVIAADGAQLLCDDALNRALPGAQETAVARAALFAAGRSYMDVVLTAAQVHGGVGTTVEHVLHHHFRRAKAMQLRSGRRSSRLRELHQGLVVRREAVEGSLW